MVLEVPFGDACSGISSPIAPSRSTQPVPLIRSFLFTKRLLEKVYTVPTILVLSKKLRKQNLFNLLCIIYICHYFLVKFQCDRLVQKTPLIFEVGQKINITYLIWLVFHLLFIPVVQFILLVNF